MQPQPIDSLFRYVRGSMLILIGLSVINTAMSFVSWSLARNAAIFGEPLELSDYDFISQARENLGTAESCLSLVFLIIWIMLILRLRANTHILVPGLKLIGKGWFIASIFLPILASIIPILLMHSIWQGSALKTERDRYANWNKIPVPWYFWASILISLAYTVALVVYAYNNYINPFRTPSDYWLSESWDVAIQIFVLIEYAFALVITWSLSQRHIARLKEFEEEQKAQVLSPAVPPATV